MITTQQLSDLSSLADYEAQHSLAQQAKARQFASQACNHGIALMGQAASENYQNRALVVQACELFMDAIQVARRQIDPYLHMARALLVFGDDRKALKYLQAARDLEPEHPDVKTYLEYLQNPQAAEKAAETASAPATAPVTVSVSAPVSTQKPAKGPSRDLTPELAMLDRELGITQKRAKQLHQVLSQQTDLPRFLRSQLGRSFLKELERLLDACDRCAESIEKLALDGLPEASLELRERSYGSLSELLNRIQDALEGVDSPRLQA